MSNLHSAFVIDNVFSEWVISRSLFVVKKEIEYSSTTGFSLSFSFREKKTKWRSWFFFKREYEAEDALVFAYEREPGCIRRPRTRRKRNSNLRASAGREFAVETVVIKKVEKNYLSSKHANRGGEKSRFLIKVQSDRKLGDAWFKRVRVNPESILSKSLKSVRENCASNAFVFEFEFLRARFQVC